MLRPGPRAFFLPVATLIAITCILPLTLAAQSISDPNFVLEKFVTVSAYSAIGMAWTPDGRALVWQKNGTIRVVKNGALLPDYFLDIRDRVNSGGDRGLMGLALDPNFAGNGYFYVSYVYEDPGTAVKDQFGPRTQRVSRFQVDPNNPDKALPGSETVILGKITDPNCNPVGQDCMPNDKQEHAIQKLTFGPDGKLWVLVGEGSVSNAGAQANAFRVQNLDVLNGKLLRINTDGTGVPDNPFFNGDPNAVRSKVWMLGLRTPFTMSFRPGSNDPFVGNVGWYSWEEIDRGKGINSGWPCYEGGLDGSGNPVVMKTPQYWSAFAAQCSAIAATSTAPPLWAYPHGGGAAIVLGPFYTGSTYPSQYNGNLFIADYNSNWIKRLILDDSGKVTDVKTFATNMQAPVFISQGPDGNLYVVSFLSGVIYRIKFTGVNNRPPVVHVSANPTSGNSPLSVQFSSQGTSDPENGALSYAWDFGDGGTSPDPNPQHTYIATGVKTFTATLLVKDPAGNSASNSVSVTVNNTPPTATILNPADNSGFTPGQTVNFNGSATDAQDGNIPESGLHWDVILHHNDHIHPLLEQIGSRGSFVVEDHAEIGAFYYELKLTATDSSGFTDTASARINVVAPKPDFSLGVDPISAAVTAGGSEQFKVTVTPVNGLKGPVALVCNSDNSSGVHCSLSSNSVDVSAGAASVTMTVSTTGSTALLYPRLPRAPEYALWLFPVAGLLACGSLGLRRRWLKTALIAVALLAGAMALQSCVGVTSSTATRSSSRTAATPRGTYTVTVSGSSGSIQHGEKVAVIVQ